MGFTPMDQVQRFLDMAPGVEKAMVDSGILLLGLGFLSGWLVARSRYRG
jgi:polyphosphate kinase 2 (PPK2 family)